MHKELTFLIAGSAASLVPDSIKLVFASKVSRALAGYPNTMLQYAPKEIMSSIDRGWTVLALGEKLEPVGFAQLWPYGFNDSGQAIWEFGSWLSFKKGCGHLLLKEGAYLAKTIDPTAQVLAIVEQENTRAQVILQAVYAPEIGHKFSPVIRTVTGEAAFMRIFDITGIN